MVGWACGSLQTMTMYLFPPGSVLLQLPVDRPLAGSGGCDLPVEQTWPRCHGGPHSHASAHSHTNLVRQTLLQAQVTPPLFILFVGFDYNGKGQFQIKYQSLDGNKGHLITC